MIHTAKRRVAMGECMRVVALLVECETPHAKELASIVLLRMKELAINDAPIEEATDEDIARMLELAALLEPEAIQ